MGDECRERGSVLMLMPAAVLVVLVLGSIAVDFSIAFLAERELVSAASAAANDAATYGLDEASLRDGGELVLDPARVREAAVRSLAARGNRLLDQATVDVDVSGTQVRVTIRSRAEYLFAAAIPGAPDGADVEATATATPVAR